LKTGGKGRRFMESVGIVKSTDGIMARVLVETEGGSCEHCEKNTCDIAERGVETEAVNAAHAHAGQKVRVVMKTYSYFKGAMILYMVPVFSLIMGAVFGKMYLPSYINGISLDLLSVFGGFTFFSASLVVVKILSSRMNRKSEYKPVIESIIEE
jgi:sigma-E factor negative regulatory protein RseC